MEKLRTISGQRCLVRSLTLHLKEWHAVDVFVSQIKLTTSKKGVAYVNINKSGLVGVCRAGNQITIRCWDGADNHPNQSRQTGGSLVLLILQIRCCSRHPKMIDWLSPEDICPTLKLSISLRSILESRQLCQRQMRWQIGVPADRFLDFFPPSLTPPKLYTQKSNNDYR